MTNKTDALLALDKATRIADKSKKIDREKVVGRAVIEHLTAVRQALAAPAVAAAVIRNLREREAMAWEQAASVDVEGLRKLFNRVNRRLEESNMPIGHALARSWESDLHGLLIDSAGGAKGDPIPPCACFDHADAICPEHRPSQPAEGDGAVAVVVSTGYPQWLVSWLDSPEYRQLPTGTKLYTRPAATAVVPEGWRVLNFTGSFKTRGERWEVYDPDGNGGAICDGDIIDPVLRNLLDALAAAPAAPKGGVNEAMVERAWEAYWANDGGDNGRDDRPAMRAALTAALATGEQS